MKFYIYTLGCKVNAYESEMMKEKLIASNYVWNEENPDIVIINTCSVTNIADQKSRKMVRRFKKNYPKSILVVAGCSSFHRQEEYQTFGIDILLGNTEKSKIVELIENYLKTKEPYVYFSNTRNLPFENMEIEKFSTHTRAFVKIQDGCDNFCSYCVIPYVRGSVRCKDFNKAVNEVKTLVSNGHKEVVLTGIHTGSYLSNEGYDLTDFIHEISKIEELKRIRISSIEITELNDKFLKELENNPKICNHLHIPLQAGSDEILIKMNRKYNLEYFENKLKSIRSIRPDISITTDVIVGHPYETEELFQNTLDTVKKFKFSKVHVFPYSKREGTLASRMPHQVKDSDKHERSKALVALSEYLENTYASSFINQTLEVLIEKDGELSIGCTSNYLKVKINEFIPNNSLVNIKVINVIDNEVIGELQL